MWETLAALRLFEARTFILGGKDVSLTLGAGSGLCSFFLFMGLGEEDK